MGFLSNITSTNTNALTPSHPSTSASHTRATYALMSRNTSSTWYGAIFLDAEFKSIGAYSGAYSYYGSTGAQEQYNSTYTNVEHLLYGVSPTQNVPSSNSTSNYVNATNVMGEYGNYMAVASERGTISGYPGRYTTTSRTRPARANKIFVNSDHPNKNVTITYDRGYLESMPLWRPMSTNFLNPYTSSERKTKTFNSTLGAGWNSMAGSASYNHVRKELVILVYQSSGGQFRLNIWKDLDLDAINYDMAQISSTPTAAFDVTLPSWNNNTNESYYNPKVVLTDSGEVFVGVMFVNSELSLYKIVRASGDASGTASKLIGQGLTTSYGADQQADYYGLVAMQTRNARMVLMFCTYYYYGSGLASFVVDKRNSTWSSSYNTSDTTYGIQPVKYRDDSFAFYYAGNYYADNYTGAYIVSQVYPGRQSSDSPVNSNINIYLPFAPGPNTTNYPGITMFGSTTFRLLFRGQELTNNAY